MGSIPVRSTKKHRMQFCIRCFLVALLVNSFSVRQYGKAVFLPRVSRLRETANSRIYQQKRSFQNCIRRFLVLFLVNRPRFVNMACHILAEGLPLAGNGKFSLPAPPKVRTGEKSSAFPLLRNSCHYIIRPTHFDFTSY